MSIKCVSPPTEKRKADDRENQELSIIDLFEGLEEVVTEERDPELDSASHYKEECETNTKNECDT